MSRGKYILMADAVGATRFSDFIKLETCMHNIEKNDMGVVVGSRAQYHDNVDSDAERVRFSLFLLCFQLVLTCIVEAVV